MATKVLDLDVQRLPSEISGLDRYDKAMALLRFRGQPLGRVMLPVADGSIEGGALRAAVVDTVGQALLTCMLHEALALPAPVPTEAASHAATIAICTRDRVDDLDRCLKALMALPDDGQEILVIDNAPSSRATERLVQQYPRVRYVHEARPGLNRARNRAIREAQGDVLAFIDDDAVADPSWLRALLKPFEDPLVMCVTGLTMPLELETEAQELFETLSGFSRRGFQRRVFESPAHNPLATGPVGAGVNMGLRRRVIQETGLFDEALDAGTPTQSGGDHEFFSRVLRAGFRIVYEPTALNWHRHRETMDALRRTLHGYGVGVYAGWTRALLREKEWGVFLAALSWLRREQLPNLLRSLLRRPASAPLRLVLAELRGCLRGPWAYFQARRQVRAGDKHHA